MDKRLCVIGLGYIGLPNAAVFAQTGFQVIGADINENVVNQIKNGQTYTEEPGLKELVNDLVDAGRITVTTHPEKADVFVVAVPTPHHEDLSANLDHVVQAINSLVPVIEKGNIIIIESTIPPRTTRDVVAPILTKTGLTVGEDIYLAHCPERVLPGRILEELYGNSRTVGGINEISAKKAADIYREVTKGKVIETIAENAEMSKLMENTYRSVNIALANELAIVSEKLAIDPIEVIALANEHPRVNLHQPGPGVGGHCIAVDPYFIIEKAKKETVLIQNAMQINEAMPEFVVEQVEKLLPHKGKVAVFGLAYKGNIDDVRDSPAVKVAELLAKRNFTTGIFDPYVQETKVSLQLTTMEDALAEADLLLILTDHNEFKQMDWEKAGRLMSSQIIFDTKHCIKNVPDNMNYYSYHNLYSIPQENIDS